MASKGPACSICCERYNDKARCPRMLNCGHSFCSDCLKKLLHDDTIDCPTCRNPVLALTGVAGLLKNFALLDIVNEVDEAPQQHAANTNRGSHSCEACDEKHPANFCCLDCKENMCKTAAQFHTRSKASRDHRVVSLEELKDNPQSALVSVFCPEHDDKFRFFDEECGHVVCRECIALDHNGHRCVSLAEAASMYRPDVEEVIAEASLHVNKIRAAEAEVGEVSLQLKRAHENGTTKIQGFFEELRKVLSDREQELIDKLDMLHNTKTVILSNEQEHLRTYLTCLERSVQRAKAIMSSSSDAELVIAMVDMVSDLEAAIESEPPELEPETDSELHVFCDRGYFVDVLKNAGEVNDSDTSSFSCRNSPKQDARLQTFVIKMDLTREKKSASSFLKFFGRKKKC